MSDLPAALRGFLAEAHDGAQVGALLAAGVLIAAGVYVAARRCWLGLKANALQSRRSPSHWRGV